MGAMLSEYTKIRCSAVEGSQTTGTGCLRGCEVSILESTQNPTGQGRRERAAAEPA